MADWDRPKQKIEAIRIDDTTYRGHIQDEVQRMMSMYSPLRKTHQVTFAWEKPKSHIDGLQTMGERIVDVVSDIRKNTHGFELTTIGTPSDFNVTTIEVRVRRL